MNYTDDHYEMLKLLETGIVFYNLTEEQKWAYHFLDSEGLIQPRADILDGYCVLSERGKCVLAEHRRAIRAAKIQIQKEQDAILAKELIRQENERKENEAQKAAEKKDKEHLNREAPRKQASNKTEHAFQYKHSLLNALLTFVSGLISGAILSNLERIILLISDFSN